MNHLLHMSLLFPCNVHNRLNSCNLNRKFYQENYLQKGQLFIENLDGNLIKFEFKNSIFNQSKIQDFTSSIYGTYHPYCNLLKLNIVMILTNIIYRK